MADTHIKIITWNAKGIRNKFFEFLNFLNGNDVDVALITETWLSSEIKLPSSIFKCYRMDRIGQMGGGVAIFIRKSIQHSLLPIVQTKIVENIGVEILLRNQRKVKIFSVYFPGGSSSEIKRKWLKQDLRKFFTMSGDFLLGGDFNCRHRDWGCLRANAWGNILSDLSLSLPINVFYPPCPTYFPAGSRGNPSVLDLFVSNVSSLITEPTSFPALSSDHNPVFCDVLWSGEKKVQYFQDLKNANWKCFRRTVNVKFENDCTQLDTINCTDEVDTLIQKFTKNILSSIEESVPKLAKKDTHKNLPFNILELIKVRNVHKRNWQRYRQPFSKTMISHFNKLISNELVRHRNDEWNHRLSRLEKNGKPFWNIVRVIKSKNRKIPFLKDSSSVFYTDTEKAEELARNFSNYHLVSHNLGDSETNNLVRNTIQNINVSVEMAPLNAHVDEKCIKNIVNSLQIRKVGGLDLIKNVYLKNLPQSGIKFLTIIINACIKLMYFPGDWKKAKVVPILKAGKAPEMSANYRPISLLSSISKIYEKVIKEQILKIVSNNDIFPNEQFGFRSFHSTSHQIKRICNYVKDHRSQGRSTGMILLDIEKAFDSVWHDGLVYKMIKLNFPVYLCKIVQSFFVR